VVIRLPHVAGNSLRNGDCDIVDGATHLPLRAGLYQRTDLLQRRIARRQRVRSPKKILQVVPSVAVDIDDLRHYQ